jgi:hypothetical protein
MSEPLIPEILGPESDTVALAKRETDLMAIADNSWIEKMGANLEQGMALFEQRAKMLEKAHTIAIARTRPEDWILFKDPQGNINAMLAGAGAEQVAEVYGVQIVALGPLDDRGIFDPVKEPIEKLPGVYALRCWISGFSRLTGRFMQNLEISRRSDEKFLGRSIDSQTGKFDFKGDGANESDMRSALQTGARTKLVRVLCGMSKLPLSELKKAGLNTDLCRQGSGFGSSQDRKATTTADAGSAGDALALWNDILKRTAGDEDAAKGVLRDITKYDAYKNKDGKEINAFAGAKSYQELNTAQRVSRAKERLAKHAVFGDNVQHDREPGEE